MLKSCTIPALGMTRFDGNSSFTTASRLDRRRKTLSKLTVNTFVNKVRNGFVALAQAFVPRPALALSFA